MSPDIAPNKEHKKVFPDVPCGKKTYLVCNSIRKLSFNMGSITLKANIELSEMDTKKYPRNDFMIIIVWMVI